MAASPEAHLFAAPEHTSILERVVVAPASGRFHPLPPEVVTSEGEWVEAGQILAEIHNGAGRATVVARFSGWLMGMLAMGGQPVKAGDALFWIRVS